MSMSINSTVSPAIPGYGRGHIKDQMATAKQLSSDLASGDIDGAQAAYATLAKNAPSSATANPNSAFAQLGKALQSGDIAGAQSAISTMVQNFKDRGTTSVPPSTGTPVPATGATVSSTGGVAGSTLNVTA
jgi:hypothetical protein